MSSAQNNRTARLPQLSRWWVALVIGVAAASGALVAARQASLDGVQFLAPLRDGFGDYNRWAVFAGLAAVVALVALLVADVIVLERWGGVVRRFEAPTLPAGSWLKRAYDDCHGIASVGGRTTIDEIRQQIRARAEEYRRAVGGGWLFKYTLPAFVLPSAGLCVAALNLRKAGTGFPMADILWPVAGVTLLVLVVFAAALLYSVRVKATIKEWEDKTLATAGRLLTAPTIPTTPTVPPTVTSPPPGGTQPVRPVGGTYGPPPTVVSPPVVPPDTPPPRPVVPPPAVPPVVPPVSPPPVSKTDDDGGWN